MTPEDLDRSRFREYRKTSTTWAVELPEDVTVQTPDGEMEAEAGDYLAIDAEEHLYPIDAEVFARTYAAVKSEVHYLDE